MNGYSKFNWPLKPHEYHLLIDQAVSNIGLAPTYTKCY